MTEQSLQGLRIVFKAAINAFDLAEDVLKMTGKQLTEKGNTMKELHKSALKVCDEINTQDQLSITKGFITLNSIIAQMEMLAAQPDNMKFERGGIEIKQNKLT